MDAHDFLKQIKDKNSLAILSGLSGITEYVQSTKIRPDLANTLFHAMIPLLNHNHYKIRSMALALTELLFLKAFNWLSDTILALPLLLFALSSVKEDIRKSARVSLAILCDSLNVEDWWSDVENCLLMSRSTNMVRMKEIERTSLDGRATKRCARKDITILKILKHMANRIPLKPIVALVDDPVKEVSDRAVDVLLAADFEKARAALIDSHLTFGAYQKVYETFMSHGQSVDLEPSHDEFMLDLGAENSIAGQLRVLGNVPQQNSVAEQVRGFERPEMTRASKVKPTRKPLKAQNPIPSQRSQREQGVRNDSARSVRSQRSAAGNLVGNDDAQSVRSQRSVGGGIQGNEDAQSVKSQRSAAGGIQGKDDAQSVRSQRSAAGGIQGNEDAQSVKSQRSAAGGIQGKDDAQSVRSQRSAAGGIQGNEDAQSVKSQRSAAGNLAGDDDAQSVRSQNSAAGDNHESEDAQSVASQRSQRSAVGEIQDNDDVQSLKSQKSAVGNIAQNDDAQSVASKNGESNEIQVAQTVANEKDPAQLAREQLKEALTSALDSTRGVRQQRSLTGPSLKMDAVTKASLRTQQSMVYHAKQFGEADLGCLSAHTEDHPNQSQSARGVRRQMSLASPTLKMDGLDKAGIRGQQSMVYRVKPGSNSARRASAHVSDVEQVPEIVVTDEFLQPQEDIPNPSSGRVRRQMSMGSPVLKMDNIGKGVRAQQSMVYRTKQFGPGNMRPPLPRPKNDDARSIKTQASARDVRDEAVGPRRTDNLNQAIPMTLTVKKKELPFTLRDMTHMSWLERCTYLEMLERAVDSEQILDVSGSDVIKCALTASFPLHKKTTPILAKLLAKLVLMYPEGLNDNLHDVVHLLLHAIRPPSILKAGNGKALLDAILSEAIPDRVIDAAVSVASENNRPVLMEQFILMVYENKPDTVLPRPVFRNLLSYLLNNRPRSEARDKLLFLLCRKDTADVIQFYHQQAKEIRVELRPFIPLEEYAAAHKQSTQLDYDIPISQRSQPWLRSAIEKEFRNGARSNFKLLAEALKALVIDDFDSLLSIFKKFLIYLSSLPESFIQEHRMELDDLCATVFASPQLFSVFDAKNVRPRIVKGFSTFIWHCPMAMLSSSAAYYPKFYKLFQESDSDQRLAIIKMAIAIENVTGQSILALKDISRLHRNVITSLLSQFQVSEIAP